MKESVICSKFGILMVFMKEKMHPERGKQNKKKPTTHCEKNLNFTVKIKLAAEENPFQFSVIDQKSIIELFHFFSIELKRVYVERCTKPHRKTGAVLCV